MAVFAKLRLEGVVQVEDKTRLDARESFAVGGDTITQVEIQPEASEAFIEVDATGTNPKSWFLDWQYSGTTRTVAVTVRLNGSTLPVTFVKGLNVLSVNEDMLFSDDEDLMRVDQDILKYVPEGRSSMLNYHRAAQEHIIDWFNQQGIWDTERNALVKDDFVDTSEVNKWSRNYTLHLIYLDLSNDVDDVWARRSNNWLSKAVEARDRSIIRVDIDGDGTIDDSDFADLTSLNLSRR